MRKYTQDRFGGDRGGSKFGGRSFGEKRSFGGRDRDSGRGRSFGGRDSGRAPSFDAVCDECGKDCKVPFEPTSGKPIYCSDCFGQRQMNKPEFGRTEFKRYDDRSGGFSGRGSYEREDHGRGGDNTQVVEKLKSLEYKLDKILQALESRSVKEDAPKSEKEVIAKVAEEIVKAKPKKARKKKE